jgi:hypothetical protein
MCCTGSEAGSLHMDSKITQFIPTVYEKHETGKRVPFSQRSSMNREDVEKLELGKPESVNIATNKPMNIPVTGLPECLHARIMGAYQYS